MCYSKHTDLRTVSRSQFTPSTMWAPGFKLRLSGLVALISDSRLNFLSGKPGVVAKYIIIPCCLGVFILLPVGNFLGGLTAVRIYCTQGYRKISKGERCMGKNCDRS